MKVQVRISYNISWSRQFILIVIAVKGPVLDGIQAQYQQNDFLKAEASSEGGSNVQVSLVAMLLISGGSFLLGAITMFIALIFYSRIIESYHNRNFREALCETYE